MKHLFYLDHPEDGLVFWNVIEGFGSLLYATLYNEVPPESPNPEGSWYSMDEPLRAEMEPAIAAILYKHRDTNFASQAGCEHVARLLASELAKGWTWFDREFTSI